MATNEIALFDIEVEQRTQTIRQKIYALGSDDWSLWALGIVVVLSLTTAIISFFMSAALGTTEPFDGISMRQSVRGLVGLILLFSLYTFFQQLKLRKKRLAVIELVEVAAQQQLRSEAFLRLAKLDPLTGLHNRRYAQERLFTEIARAQRNKGFLTIMRLNLDNFQELNDSYGSSVGEEALRVFGKRLNAAIRGSDIAVRLGGEEFVALLPQCQPTNAQVVLNRLDPMGFEFEGKQFVLAFSAGLAGYREGDTVEQLLERASNVLHSQRASTENHVQPI